MDEEVIELGKSYAKSQGISLSKLVERFIKEAISGNNNKPGNLHNDLELMLLFPPRDPDNATISQPPSKDLEDYFLAHQNTYYSIEEE